MNLLGINVDRIKKKLSLGVFGASNSATAVYTSYPLERGNGDGSIKTERKRTSLAPLDHWQKHSESVTCNRFPLRPVSPLFHVATISTAIRSLQIE